MDFHTLPDIVAFSQFGFRFRSRLCCPLPFMFIHWHWDKITGNSTLIWKSQHWEDRKKDFLFECCHFSGQPYPSTTWFSIGLWYFALPALLPKQQHLNWESETITKLHWDYGAHCLLLGHPLWLSITKWGTVLKMKNLQSQAAWIGDSSTKPIIWISSPKYLLTTLLYLNNSLQMRSVTSFFWLAMERYGTAKQEGEPFEIGYNQEWCFQLSGHFHDRYKVVPKGLWLHFRSPALPVSSRFNPWVLKRILVEGMKKRLDGDPGEPHLVISQ